MKRIIFIVLFTLTVLSSFGQFYLQPSLGYTFSSHPTEYQSILTINNQKTVYKTKFKYGEGMHLGLILGYGFTNNFFVELNSKKSIYSKYYDSTPQPDLQSLNNFSSSGYFGKIEYESSIFQISPLIGFKIDMKKNSVFFKLGPNFMKSRMNRTLDYIDWRIDNSGLHPLNTIKKYEYSGKLHVGLQANLGFNYPINQNLQFVLDFVTVYNNYEVTKGEIKSYEIDGVSHIQELEDTKFDIVEEEDKFNHSHYGINIGISYIFNKKQ